MGKPPRRGIATMKLDLDFFDDPSVQELYEENTPEDADGAAMLFLRMAMRAHRLDRPDVLSEFSRSKSERRQRLLATLVNAGLIDSNGIRPSTFDKWRMPDRGWYDSERGRAGGLARAEQRRASVEPALDSVDAAFAAGAERSGAERSSSLSLLGGSTSPNDNGSLSDEDLLRDGLPSLTRAAVEEFLPRTNHTSWSQIPNKALGELDRLVGVHGLEAVLAAVDKVRNGKRLTANQVIWTAGRALEPFATVDEKEERQAQADDSMVRRIERSQITAHDGGGHVDPAEFPRCPKCRGEVA